MCEKTLYIAFYFYLFIIIVHSFVEYKYKFTFNKLVEPTLYLISNILALARSSNSQIF